jgi:hypothetical protein
MSTSDSTAHFGTRLVEKSLRVNATKFYIPYEEVALYDESK